MHTHTIGGNFATPVYRMDGALVATSAADLWDEVIANPINISETGEFPSFVAVWTGTTTTGAGVAGSRLGQSGVGAMGSVFGADGSWVQWQLTSAAFGLPLYRISDILTVPDAVPEPGGFMLIGGGLFLLWGVRKRRATTSQGGTIH